MHSISSIRFSYPERKLVCFFASRRHFFAIFLFLNLLRHFREQLSPDLGIELLLERNDFEELNGVNASPDEDHEAAEDLLLALFDLLLDLVVQGAREHDLTVHVLALYAKIRRAPCLSNVVAKQLRLVLQ